MQAFAFLAEALGIVLQPMNLFALFISTFFGLLVGMLPGLTSTMAVALLTGLSFGLPHQTALIVVISVYVGAVSGGCQSAILLNIPGTPASAATALDGYPMGQQGKAGLAIFLATFASFMGTLISVLCVLLLTPFLTDLALEFTSPEFFLLALFGIMICGSLASQGDTLKGWIAGLLGLLIAQVGLDTMWSVPRFSFGLNKLIGGIQLIPIMIGLFGFPQILGMFKNEDHKVLELTKFKLSEGFAILRKNILNILRSAMIGVGVGVIPGVGEDTGGWLSYWAVKIEKKKELDQFGKGHPSGIIAAETGNNSCIGGAIIPVISLAVPGSTSAAVLLAAFQLHGYIPGPNLMNESPDFLYKVSIYLACAAVMMWLLSMVISKFSVKILGVKKEILMPIIVTLCVVGSFVVRSMMFDVKLMFLFGLIGFVMFYVKLPAAPFLLGVILGNMADHKLRLTLQGSGGSLAPFFTRPICIFFLIIIVILACSQLGVFKYIAKKRAQKKAA
ncbi:MAG: tripartite tricarboxylate transporter permease [Clostridia bacterium]|nr:tripartite tricarboxylate transporter permease [Clostridia bacterium]